MKRAFLILLGTPLVYILAMYIVVFYYNSDLFQGNVGTKLSGYPTFDGLFFLYIAFLVVAGIKFVLYYVIGRSFIRKRYKVSLVVYALGVVMGFAADVGVLLLMSAPQVDAGFSFIFFQVTPVILIIALITSSIIAYVEGVRYKKHMKM